MSQHTIAQAIVVEDPVYDETQAMTRLALFGEDGEPVSLGGTVGPAVGDTENRPAEPETGDQYFDTDLGMPIWWNGTIWVDATSMNADPDV